MITPYTISAHFGTKMSRNHNIRNRKITDKEEHIDKNGYFKIIEDTPIRQAYFDTFGHALLEYNAKQPRAERRISDYYTKVVEDYKRDPKRNPAPAQEVIFTIGNINHHPSKERSEKLLRAYLDEFKKNNPNIVVFGAYFHADEPGSAPHLHVDFFFVKRENKRGLSLQVGQEGALREMGYKTEGRAKEGTLVTAQTKWQRTQRELLRSMAKEHGMIVQEVDEQEKGELKHLDTKIFKKKTELAKVEEDINEQHYWLENAKILTEKAKSDHAKATQQLQEIQGEIMLKEIQYGTLDSLKKENEELKEQVSILENAVNVLQRAFNFTKKWLKKLNFFDKFKSDFVKEGPGQEEWSDFVKVRQSNRLNKELEMEELGYLDGFYRDKTYEEWEEELNNDAELILEEEPDFDDWER